VPASRPPRDPWAVPEIPLLARSAHDRLAERRTDQVWLERTWQRADTRVLLLSPSGTAALSGDADEPSLRFLPPEQVESGGTRVFLGEAGGQAYFAHLAIGEMADEGWTGLREVGALLTDLDVGLLTTAVALRAWHVRHRHCPRCGAVTEVAQAGWSRVCPEDGSEHFPRTDPAVIMLVHDGAGHCVLARGPQWAPGRMSVLAGFVEAGESAEAAVAREVGEEVGIAVRDVRYAGSQPHPFPASLMLGFTALVDGDPTLRLDDDEIVEAGWFSREEVRRTGEWGDEHAVPDGELPVLRGLPPTMSIARQLINGWLLDTD
jgi:NAD+ diphosphatase